MALSIIQLEGTVKFGTTASTTSVATQVHGCSLKRTFDAVEIRGTFASSRNTTKPGNFQDELTVQFDNDGLAVGSSSLAALIHQVAWAATPSNILYFEFTQDNGAVSTDNLRITGTVSVMEAMKGGTIGELREQEITFPVLTLTMASV